MRINAFWRLVGRVLLLGMLLGTGTVRAHDIPPSLVWLDLGQGVIGVELELQLSELASATQLPLESDPEQVASRFRTELDAYLHEHLAIHSLDGRRYALQVDSLSLKQTRESRWISNDWLIVKGRFWPPGSASTTKFILDDSVILHRVLSHATLVYVRRDVRNGLLGEHPLLVGTLAFGNPALRLDGSDGSWFNGFRHTFMMGLSHIATGPDHLLFLLTLLLPAPLLARAGRWRGAKGTRASVRTVLGVVTGFTLGHFLTLALAAAGVFAVPIRPVEIAIAASILISSMHARWPLFAGREVLIASAFGLVHGLAFAEVLAGLNFDPATLVLSLAGFNLGIETMQLAIIAVILPPLLLLSGSAAYAWLRNGGALFSACCACGWLVERVMDRPNPMAPVINALTAPPRWSLLLTLLAGAAATGRLALRAWRVTPASRSPRRHQDSAPGVASAP